MKEQVHHIPSISHLHEVMGFEKPSHPLVSIIDVSQWVIDVQMVGKKFVTDLYAIGMKDRSCGLQYGRNAYDFDEGVMFFAAPKQVTSPEKEQKRDEIQGWMLFFHPDLIRNTNLGLQIDQYTYFSYDVHEALHLSEAEQQTVTDCVGKIRQEIAQRIDNHSQRVIISSLELLLNYCLRFYERQFNTRTAKNKDVVSQFESLLKQYYQDGNFETMGIPTLAFFADHIKLSPNYLSDLLRKETGRSAKDHVNDFVIEKAKTLLLGSNDSVSEVAYRLGFNYPNYFSRLFKSKTGATPKEYRKSNN